MQNLDAIMILDFALDIVQQNSSIEFLKIQGSVDAPM